MKRVVQLTEDEYRELPVRISKALASHIKHLTTVQGSECVDRRLADWLCGTLLLEWNSILSETPCEPPTT
jgi:hypothetical protein